MKILLIQENGRHNENRHFRECFCLQRSFIKLGFKCDIWGLGHDNFKERIDFNQYDLIINLENYGNGWEPNLNSVKSKKILWSVDSHFRGEKVFIDEFNRGDYNILLHSTKDYVDQPFKVWFPNAYDDSLIFPMEIDQRCDVGFCGSLLNRQPHINLIKNKFNFIHDNFVIGNKMVESINSYKIHWNKNVSNDINYRSFETIGCGIPLITNYNYQYDLLGFNHGVNVMMYKNEQEMIDSINILLNNDTLRKSIGEGGLELSKNHTYDKRVLMILEILKNIS